MSTQRCSVIPHPIETLLTWPKSGEVAMRPLVHEIARIEGMATTVETITERLREHRSALIAAAVTWKIDVRGAAA